LTEWRADPSLRSSARYPAQTGPQSAGLAAPVKPIFRSVAAHEQSLFDLNAKYADVVSLDETMQYLKTVGHNRPAN